ncbi:hypothetical protein HPB48_000216 [Haemaphysalis longicornis]|uniref:YqaJ viral recombinase domain-containing protein n=1 Tax=Haemaphysalis longicornis TaxID=44386 RepID=A0A9J6GA58_HAELO|nr:hypothetical protein HPB48_000216 [Haemaphysalis longicornis]
MGIFMECLQPHIAWSPVVPYCNNVQLFQMGLLIHPDQPWLCGSPDGIFCLAGETYLLEIKCPKKCENDGMFGSSGKSVLDYVQGTCSESKPEEDPYLLHSSPNFNVLAKCKQMLFLSTQRKKA